MKMKFQVNKEYLEKFDIYKKMKPLLDETN